MTREDILNAVKAGVMTIEEATAELNRKDQKALSCKVSEKGGLSVYGLQRMPVTLYSGQWERLLDYSDSIREFIIANRATLATKKPEKEEAPKTEAPKTPKTPNAKDVMANMGQRKAG